MNLNLKDKQIECIRLMNQENIHYIVHYEASANNHLEIHFKYPENLGEEKLIKKMLGFKEHDLFRFVRSRPNGNQFLADYTSRYIINQEGLEINFKRSEALVPYLSTKKRVQVNLEHSDHYEVIATLHRYNIQYLIIDHYPIEGAFGKKYDSPNYMVVWFKREDENCKLIRKANKLLTGNPPSLPSISKKDRLFMQGQVYWRNHYKNLNFDAAYKRRCILNIDGLSTPFLHQDDLF